MCAPRKYALHVSRNGERNMAKKEERHAASAKKPYQRMASISRNASKDAKRISVK
jgi:hypothetical protein